MEFRESIFSACRNLLFFSYNRYNLTQETNLSNATHLWGGGPCWASSPQAQEVDNRLLPLPPLGSYLGKFENIRASLKMNIFFLFIEIKLYPYHTNPMCEKRGKF